MTDDTFQALIQRARAGDGAAVNELLQVVRPLLRRDSGPLVANWLRMKHDTSDLIQASLLEALPGLSEFNGSSLAEFAAWMWTILRNNNRDAIKHFRREKADIGREVPLDGLPIAGADESPSGAAIAAEANDRLQAAFQQLSADDRQIIELRHTLGKEYSEISQIMDRSEDAVKKLFTRARKRWKQLAFPHGA